MTTTITTTHRARRYTPTRRAMAVAGTATLGFSLVLSIGPVLAASGTVKIHDGVTGDDAGNDPHVCSFYAAFYTTEATESGAWELIDWDGEREAVASGTYDTSAGGVDMTPVMAPAPGQYRFEWLPAGDRNAKNKMLWVDDCATDPSDESDPSDEASPSGDPSGEASPSGDPSGEVDPSEAASPSGDPSDDASPSGDPSDEASPSGEPSGEVDPSDDASPSGDPSDEASPSGDPSDEASPSGDPSDEVEPSENPAPSNDPSHDGGPSEDPAPSNDPAPTNDGDPDDQDGSGDREQDVQSGNSGGGHPTLPDTSMPVSQSGVLATIGVLLILAAHAGIRRERQLPAA